MNPRWHCGGENIIVVKNKIEGDWITHVCFCTQCKEAFLVQQTVKQWQEK